jgi:molecular chaperone DnaJ
MDVDPFEIFRNFMGGFGFGDIFGGAGPSGGPGSRTTRGRDLQINLAVSLEEIAEGTSKTIKVNRFQPCDTCDGSGAQEGSEPVTCSTCKGVGQVKQVSRSFLGQMVNIATCPQCNGEGTIVEDPCPDCSGQGRRKQAGTVKVGVPAGVEEGQYLNMSGEGHAGPRGGPPGDLIVVFEQKAHEVFERNGDDILYMLRISIPEAVLGASMTVPTIGGEVEMEIPAGVQPGRILRMKGKGIRHLNSPGRGDQLVRVDVYVPEKLNGKQREVFEEMLEDEAFQPPARTGKGFLKKMKEAFFGG